MFEECGCATVRAMRRIGSNAAGMYLLDGELGHCLLSYWKPLVLVYYSTFTSLPVSVDHLQTSITSCESSSVCSRGSQLRFVLQTCTDCDLTMSALLIWASSCFSRALGEVASAMVVLCEFECGELGKSAMSNCQIKRGSRDAA